MGRVRQGDLVHIKMPSGPVVARGIVAHVGEEKAGGRYVLTLRFRALKRLPAPFSVEKHDRRSWVVCPPPDDASQQRLLAASLLTIDDLARAMRATRRKLPSRRAIRAQLASLAREAGTDGALLVWLALLAEAADQGKTSESLRGYLRKPARRVIPFAVF